MNRREVCQASFALAALAPLNAKVLARDVAPLTLADAINHEHCLVAEIRWRDDETILTSIRRHWSTDAEVVAWKLNGAKVVAPAGGDYATISPDGKRLAYFDKRWWLKDLSSQVVLPLGEEASVRPWISAAPTWSGDSGWVATVDQIPPPQPEARSTVATVDGVRFVDVNADLLAPDAGGPHGPRLTITNVESKQTQAIQLSEDFLYYGEWGLGGKFFFSPMQSYFGGTKAYSAVRCLDATTGAITEVYRQEGFHQSLRPKVSPDGRWLAITIDATNLYWDDFVGLLLIDLRGGSTRMLTQDVYIESAIWAADSGSLYCLTRNGGLNQLCQVFMDTRVRPLAKTALRRSKLGMSPNGRWLSFQTEDGYGRRDIRVISTRSGVEKVVTVLSHAPEKRLGEFRSVSWASRDGLVIRGFLIFPPDFNHLQKYALYVDVHGGGNGADLSLASSAFGLQTPLDWHAIAALGYVVFVPDMRSSGEYGPKVAMERYTEDSWDPSGVILDSEDVEDGVRWLLSQGFIDPARVAILGHSAGGPRVAHLLAGTTLFSAGILHEPSPTPGAASQIGFVTGKNTGGRLLTSFNSSSPSDKPQAYQGGPLFEAAASRTPTLIMVGNPDIGGSPAISAEITYSLLRANGVPTRLIRYLDDGHIASSASAAMHRYSQITRWLQTYLTSPVFGVGR